MWHIIKSFSFRTVLLLLTLLFWRCENPKSSPDSLLEWVPQNTSIVIEVNNFNEIENALKNNVALKAIPKTAEDLAKEFGLFRKNEQDSPSLYFLTRLGKDELATSVVYHADFDSIYNTYETIEYNGEKIYRQTLGKNTIYSCFIKESLLQSNSQIVLENCVRNYGQKGQKIEGNDFIKLSAIADKDAAVNLYVWPGENHFFQKLFGAMPLFPNIKAQWSAYDLGFGQFPIALNGVVEVHDSLGDPLALLHKNEEEKIVLDQVVPQTMTSFFSFPLNQLSLVEDSFKKYVRYHNIALPNIDLSPLKSVDEIGLITFANDRALLFHLNNEEEASNYFIPEVTEKKYRSISYYPIDMPSDIAYLLKATTTETMPQWVSKIDDFLLFAETESGIKTLIAAYREGKTLVKLNAYKKFKETQLAQKNDFFWIINAERGYQHSKQEKMENSFWKYWDRESFPFIALQGIGDKHFMQLHFSVAHKTFNQVENEVTQQVLIDLEAPLQSGIQWVKNHRTKEYDVLAQDEENTLYLFSNTGKLFWKKQLAGRIQGKVSQVDLYKNGRLQLVFRTEGRLYVLDRNGKDVAPFPKKVNTSTPIHPLAVFDYDQRRDYRFVLAQGKTVQMWNGKGKRVSGFKFSNTKSPIMASPKHIRINSKDYIVVPEENGKLHILNRMGQTRIPIKDRFRFSTNEIQSYLKTFTFTDQAGNLNQIDTEGNVVVTPLGLDQNHHFTSTTKSVVTLSGNELVIKGLPVSLPYGRYTAPAIYYFNNTIYVSVTDLDAEKVYLYYSDGQLVGGFPVYGTSAIDLINSDKDKALEFSVQSEDNGILIYEIK